MNRFSLPGGLLLTLWPWNGTGRARFFIKGLLCGDRRILGVDQTIGCYCEILKRARPD